MRGLSAFYPATISCPYTCTPTNFCCLIFCHYAEHFAFLKGEKEDRGGKRRKTFHTLFFCNCLVIFAVHFKNHVIAGGLRIFFRKQNQVCRRYIFYHQYIKEHLLPRVFIQEKRRTREEKGGNPFTPCFFVTV